MNVRVFRTLKEAEEARSGEDKIFAEDVNAKGAKRWLVGPALEMLGRRCLNEVILGDMPCRLFADFDGAADMGDVMEFQDAVREAFGGDSEFAVLESSSAKKFSVHVICPGIWLKDVATVGEIVSQMTSAADMGVYHARRCFRAPGCSKFAEPDRRMGRYPPSPALWRNSLVQGLQAHHVLSTPSWASTAPQLPSVSGRVGRSGDGPEAPLPKEVMAYLRERFGAANVLVSAQGWVRVHHSAVVCPSVGRCHRSEDTRVVYFARSREVALQCFNVDCNKRIFGVHCPFSLQKFHLKYSEGGWVVDEQLTRVHSQAPWYAKELVGKSWPLARGVGSATEGFWVSEWGPMESAPRDAFEKRMKRARLEEPHQLDEPGSPICRRVVYMDGVFQGNSTLPLLVDGRKKAKNDWHLVEDRLPQFKAAILIIDCWDRAADKLALARARVQNKLLVYGAPQMLRNAAGSVSS